MRAHRREVNTDAGPGVETVWGVALLGDLFDLDRTTGIAVWKSRPLTWFPSYNAFATWNTRYAGRVAGAVGGNGYVMAALFHHPIRMHRVVFAMCNGVWPSNMIDHANGVRSDNRPVNLANVTRLQNQRNMARPKNNRSGVVGVSWSTRDRRWVASISNGETVKHIGSFVAKADAIAARALAAKLAGYHENHGRVGV